LREVHFFGVRENDSPASELQQGIRKITGVWIDRRVWAYVLIVDTDVWRVQAIAFQATKVVRDLSFVPVKITTTCPME